MVERLNGIQEVRGSTPLVSTKRDVYAHFRVCVFLLYRSVTGDVGEYRGGRRERGRM